MNSTAGNTRSRKRYITEAHEAGEVDTDACPQAGSKRIRTGGEAEIGDNVCPRCRAIDWNDVIRPPAGDKWNQPRGSLTVLKLADGEDLLVSSCRICRIIASVKPPALDGKRCVLQKYSARSTLNATTTKINKALALCDSTFLAMKSTSTDTLKWSAGVLGVYHVDQVVDCGLRKIRGDAVDIALLKSFMKHCRETHGESCAPSSRDTLKELRVIDCQDASHPVLLAPPNCKYAALSYVWGGTVALSESVLPQASHGQYSQVVKDAIAAATALGISYLWVDRHCIAQGDDVDMHTQIAQMGQIYGNAEITIIAAAGQDSSYGLPGMGTVPRQEQRTERIGDIVLLQGFPHASHTLKSTKWASRGWTYQEGYLSPRRLIFTDNQVSFLCNKMHCAESEKQPLQVIGTHSTTRFRDMIPRLDKRNQISWASAEAQIVEYTRRKLTFSSDALNACLGLLETLSGASIPSIWGVLVKSFSPATVASFMISWYHESPATRRPEFPSWSPLGWDGPINSKCGQTWLKTICECGLGTITRSHFTLAAVADGALTRQEPSLVEAMRYLHLTGPVVPLSIVDIQWTKDQQLNSTVLHLMAGNPVILKIARTQDGLYARLPMTPDINMLVFIYLDQPITSALDGVVGVPIYTMSFTDAFTLVFARRGGVYERIGFLRYRLWSAGGAKPSHVAFEDADGTVLDEITTAKTCYFYSALWLANAQRKTIIVG